MILFVFFTTSLNYFHYKSLTKKAEAEEAEEEDDDNKKQK